MSEDIKVSVCCFTFNHEKFIRDAMEGFLMQKTDFPFEILVHDDASTDETAGILREYQEKHPDLFRIVYQTENQYSKGRKPSTILLPMAKGKYIALCEGDDYWTDPLKLQKQFEFMENNLDYSGCFHNVYKLHEETGEISLMSSRRRHDNRTSFSTEDLVQGGVISTCSFFFRNDAVLSYPETFLNLPTGDIPLFVLVSQRGKIGFINEVMSIYRIHNKGIWSGSSIETKSMQNIQVNEVLDRYLGYEYHEKILPSLFLHWHDLALYYSNCDDRKKARGYINKCIQNLKYRSRVSNKKLIKTIINVYLPALNPIISKMTRFIPKKN